MFSKKIMGILNITPDSFSDGGENMNPKSALLRAEKMMNEGAIWIDIGAESSAPHSVAVSEQEEWKRLENILPPLVFLANKKNVQISVDTYKSGIAKRALDLGVHAINDITAFRADAKMPRIIAQKKAKIILMFSKNNSARTTFQNTTFQNILNTLFSFFEERIKVAKKAGIATENIFLDPGMGAFLSADPAVSFLVIKKLSRLKKYFPRNKILIGTSRKSFLREVSDAKNPKNRLVASLVSAIIAAQNGADILRVHDVAPTHEALKTLSKIEDV